MALLVAISLDLGQPQAARISEAQAKAVVQAIEDEIYDYEYQVEFLDVKTHLDSARLTAYINPELRDGSVGEVVYKLMPHGEIIRWFQIMEDGLIILDREPEVGFPPTSQSMKTVYLNDETLLQMKLNWQKHQYTVLLSPPAERVRQAVERQKKRYGFSAWEGRHLVKTTKKRRKKP